MHNKIALIYLNEIEGGWWILAPHWKTKLSKVTGFNYLLFQMPLLHCY